MNKLSQALIRKEIALRCKVISTEEKIMDTLKSKKGGDGYIGTAVNILISIAIGSLLLAGLVWVFKVIIFPDIKSSTTNMFNTTSSSLIS